MTDKPIIRLLTIDGEHLDSVAVIVPLPKSYVWNGRTFRRVEQTADYVEAAQQRINASDVDPTAGADPKFNWGGDP